MRYFKNFPKIQYNDLVIHAPIRFAFQKIILDHDYNMWDYIIGDDQSPEYIALKYYEDAHLDWMVLLANQIINSYYSWPLSDRQLEAYLEKKYGSIEQAMSLWVNHKDVDGVAIHESQYNSSHEHSRQSAYQYETELNNQKRNIKLIDSKYAIKFKQDLDDYLIREQNQLSYYLQYNPQFKFSL